MHFPDLTPYEYGRTERQANVLNVGWLSKDHPFPSGAVDERLVAALQQLVLYPVNLYRGSHLCEFCPAPPTKLSAGGIPMLDPPPGTTGNGEIRITARNGITYVAPVLILHYVTAHGYLPPREFIEAVISTTSRMTFAAVLGELKKMLRADLARPNHDVLEPSPLVTDAHIRRWKVATELPTSELYDRIAIYLARGFHHHELAFGFCDQVVNDIHAVITNANEDRPNLFWDVFLSFDAGEFCPNTDRSRDPVESYTRPLIAKVVEKHSIDYPDIV